MLLTGNVFAQEAQDNSASEPVEREVNLKEVVKFNWGFQGATQGAGTPNQAGLGFFLPMMVSDNGVLFLGRPCQCQLCRLRRLLQHH